MRTFPRLRPNRPHRSPCPNRLRQPAAAEYVPPPPMDRAAPWAAPVAEPPRRVEADLLVTESMAELLAEQGHAAEALTVYRQLESRTPANRASRRGSQSSSIRRPSAPRSRPERRSRYRLRRSSRHGQLIPCSRRRGSPCKRFSGASSARGWPPVRSPAIPSLPVRRPPTRTARRPGLRTTASRSARSSAMSRRRRRPRFRRRAAGGQGGVSFDEFFGAPGASTTPRPPRAPDSKSDDLDQFHAWLQNLKR